MHFFEYTTAGAWATPCGLATAPGEPLPDGWTRAEDDVTCPVCRAALTIPRLACRLAASRGSDPDTARRAAHQRATEIAMRAAGHTV